ncbi:putative Sporulation protein RMD1 [Nannochloris sp. 'desiccata']|nr:hypothetical protein KSW81_004675 [Chlorella desiccata (nom. nud.)]KAH7618369.1 putative Sporulation protein RMD1 [Chlorella desiccata (nom. nud.)]
MQQEQQRSQDDMAVGRSSSIDNLAAEDGFGRSTSAPRERQPRTTPHRDARHRPPQPIRTLLGRTAGRLIPLGPAWEAAAALVLPESLPPDLALEPVPLVFQGQGLAVRVRCYSIGKMFDRARLQDQILKRSSASSIRAFPEVMSSVYRVPGGDAAQGDIFYFDWGCIVFWGLEKSMERHIIKEIAEPCLEGDALSPDRIERDQLRLMYTSSPKTVMENDTLALHFRFAGDFNVKLAISFALAQSTKLSVAEEELRRMGKRLAYVPDMLADSGEVPLTERDTMRAVGHLYRQMAAVTLLGAALDVPDAMDSAPSNITALYKASYDYLEVAERLSLLNDRFQVMKEMLELCRTLGQQAHYAYLEKIIIWLIGLCVLIAVLQLIAFLGWRPAWRQ